VWQVQALLDGDPGWATRARAFVHAFVRPHGLEAPAAPIFAQAVGALAAQPRPVARPDGVVIALARVPALLLAHAAWAVAEGRPLWAYAMRPVVTAGVWAMAVPYGVGSGWDAHARPALKRARRGAWSAWYESTQRLGQGLRRFTKRVRRLIRDAGGVAKRAVGLR
jgi:hypothetical protein